MCTMGMRRIGWGWAVKPKGNGGADAGFIFSTPQHTRLLHPLQQLRNTLLRWSRTMSRTYTSYQYSLLRSALPSLGGQPRSPRHRVNVNQVRQGIRASRLPAPQQAKPDLLRGGQDILGGWCLVVCTMQPHHLNDMFKRELFNHEMESAYAASDVKDRFGRAAC